jgi:two-component system nitrogen regulation response regulator NtrX
MFTTQPNLSLKEARLRFEKDYIKAALYAHDCNLRKTAEALDMHYSNMLLKLKRLGITIKHQVEVNDG